MGDQIAFECPVWLKHIFDSEIIPPSTKGYYKNFYEMLSTDSV